jgi:hypothetical protein
LGLSAAQVSNILDKLTGLQRGAVKAGDGRLALMQARLAYDSDMRKTLGESGYAQYRAFEDAKPFRREVGALGDFCQQFGETISPADQTRLVAMFQQSNLQSMESWDGPYDPLPNPLVGKEIIPTLEASIARIQSGSAKFRELAADQLPESLVDRVAAYFQSRVDSDQRGIAACSKSFEERMLEMQKRVQELFGKEMQMGEAPAGN